MGSSGILFLESSREGGAKMIYCFNILTLSRCTDHKLLFTVYFYNMVHALLLCICMCLCVCMSELVSFTSVCDRRNISFVFFVWNWCDKERERWDRERSKHANLAHLYIEIISLKTTARLSGLEHQMNIWCHCFHNLNHFLSLFKHKIRLDEICIGQYCPMTGPSVNVIGKLLAKLMFFLPLCRFVLTTGPWIFHRPYVMVYKGHRGGI